MSNSNAEHLGFLRVKQAIAKVKEIIYFGDSPQGYPLEFLSALELEKLEKEKNV